MIIARLAPSEVPPGRRERERIRVDESRRGDPTMTGSPFLGNGRVASERQEGSEPIRLSTAFCAWLLIGGPLL